MNVDDKRAKLAQLLDRVRQYRMSPEELAEQAVSFAFGNVHYENGRVTREGVRRAIRLLDVADGSRPE